jgi:hypothetical protein
VHSRHFPEVAQQLEMPQAQFAQQVMVKVVHGGNA